MGICEAISYIQMEKGSNNPEKGRARWGVLCGNEEYTEGVGVAWNEKKQHQIYAQEC